MEARIDCNLFIARWVGEYEVINEENIDCGCAESAELLLQDGRV
jgi:hypothetical protein